MAGNNNSETFKIIVDSNAAKTAREDANELDNLRKRFEQSTNSIKQLEAAQKRLNQAGVVNIQTAKELKTRIEAEKNTLAALTTKIHTAGTSFEELSSKAKENSAKMGEANKAALAFADAAGGALVGALIAVEAAAILSAAGLAKFVLESRNLARTQNLARAAVTGSVEDAKRLGSQIDALALKVPTAKGEINDMAIEMRRAGLSGQTLVDALNAASQASAALGGDAGKKVEEFISRGKLMGNFSLNQFETMGTGLPDFKDVAAALAKNLHVGIADAEVALVQGRVRLADGAKAMRDALESKFGALNLAKMLDLDVMKTKFHELLQMLTSGIDIEPLLKELKDFFSLFDQSTMAGASLKKLVTVFGQGFISLAVKGLPIMKGFFEGMILAALDLYIAILRLRIGFKDTFGDGTLFKNIDLVKIGVQTVKVAVVALTVAFGLLAIATLLALSPVIILFGLIAAAVGIVVLQFTLMKKAFEWLLSIDWSGMGKAIVDGLTKAFDAIDLSKKGAELGAKLKDGFKKSLGIASPSKVFEQYGVNTTEGYSRGIDRGTPAVNNQIADMATPSKGGTGGASASSVTVTFGDINIAVDGSKHEDTESIVAELRKEFRNEVTRMFERDATNLGMKRAG
jgi:hypothetical protein